MASNSLLYAVGRLRMLRRNMLNPGQFQRLITAPDMAETAKALLEFGYLSPDRMDAEQASMDRLTAAAAVIRKLSPEPATTDSFFMRNDVHNLKTLLKARILGEEPEGLSPAGTIELDLLRHAVSEHRYSRLPIPLRDAMEALEAEAALKPDPMGIDVRLDRAMYLMMAEGLKASSSPAARAWLAAKADFVNLRAFLRLKDMRASLALQDVLVTGGKVPLKAVIRASAAPQALIARYHRLYGKMISQPALLALEDRARISALEQAMEGYLQGLFAPNRMKPDSLDVMIDYLLSMEKESAAVRLIAAGKRNGLSPEAIEERLRQGYGG